MDEEKKIPSPAGKRLVAAGGPAHKRPVVILLAVLALLVLLYAALCAWVAFGGRILPGVYAGQELVGNLSPEEAASRIRYSTAVRLEGLAVPFTYGEDGAAQVPGSWAAADAEAAAQAAWQAGRAGSPLTYGFHFLSGFFRPVRTDVPLAFTQEGADQLDQLLRQEETPVTETVYIQGEDAIQVTKGIPGSQYDRAQLQLLLLDAMASQAVAVPQDGRVPGFAPIHVDPVPVDPAPIDWAALARELAVDPADAYFNAETLEIEPAVIGVSLDTTLAANLYDSAKNGAVITIPLTFTQPEVTTEVLEATLFHDLMGEAVSTVSGSSNRAANVKLALSLATDLILMPGDEFSYWDKISPCSRSQGFLPAPSYVDGQTVDSVGGGVCQVSSSIYYAALLSNLEIVERRHHSYAVGYLPDGVDATVFSGNPDFRFKNNTSSPIKLVGILEGRKLTVQIWGTKTDDTYVKVETRRLSTTNYETIYKPDASVPVGTTKESVTPYTGRKVEAYRCIYAADGTLLSRTLESVNNYKKRDRVILYNPEDAYLYDPNAAAPSPSPAPEPTPVPSADPTPSAEPSVSPPSETPSPSPTEEIPPEFVTPSQEPTPTPAPLPTPEPSQEPVSTQPPAAQADSQA